MHIGMDESLLLLALGLFAGSIGALVGIGGGIIVVPALAVGFGLDIRIAVASSLVAVVATSASAGMAYAREGLTNLRLALTLEIPTTIGALVGGLIAVTIAPSVIFGTFGVVVVVIAVLMWRHVDVSERLVTVEGAEPGSGRTNILAGSYFDRAKKTHIHYAPVRLGIGWSVSSLAGLLSGMLGVGGGFLKVPTLTMAMQVPNKAAAATSNFMVGITAVASLTIYLARGFVEPAVVVPVVLGVVVGALVTSRVTNLVPGVVVQRVLAVILVVIAIQMLLEAVGIDAA